MDTTAWFYDEATGPLTNKLYADGKGTAYTYTSDGQLASRIWARGVTTTYVYTNGSMIAIDYSDSTPDVAFTYDRLGRQVLATVAGVSTNLYSYTLLGQLTNETVFLCASAPLRETISRSYDTHGRPAGIALSNLPYDVGYAYDIYGRFIAVTAQVHTLTHGYTYGYLPGSDLVATMANSHGHTATRTYDLVLPHITHVHNGFTGGRTISQYDYTYDALGRRTAIASSGEVFTFSNANDLAAFNLYGYNGRSEVTSAARYWGTDTGDTSAAVDGQEYAYAFDPIGNRITAAEGDTSRTASYTANELNQYSQRTVPGVKELAGTALADATVTVNELPTDRFGPWWRHAFAVDNGSSAAYTQAVVTAVYNPPGTNDPDVVTSQTGRVFVAETPEAFTYDDDGNLLSDGRFSYTWDAENRLISATTRDDLPADLPRVRVTHQYDHQSRRIATARETWSGAAWQQAGTNRYLYDGWNIVQETINHQQSTTNHYVWGLDLSGTLQGAGGIGGLLTVRKRLEDGTGIVRNYDFLFDANGNVVQEIFRTDGAINAHYEYDPFGNTVVATGVDATDNPFRFSTKWFDNDTGLIYYGYRFYSPQLGRWLSWDPIGEKGGLNLYSFVFNTPQNGIDRLGLKWNKVNCWGIGTSASYAAYDILGGTISLGVKGTLCDCCNDVTGEMKKRDYFDITATSGGSIGIGLGGEVKMPFAGRVGFVLKGPQITINNAFSLTKECGEPCPELSYTILNISADKGGSFAVGSSWGIEVSYNMSYGVKAGFAIGCRYFKFFATAYASGEGDVTLTAPWIDIHKSFLLDEKSASWEPTLKW